MTTATPEKTDGLKALQLACEEIEKAIATYDGVFQMKMAPKVVTATDEADLVRQMERAEAENAEISGDEDEENQENYNDAEENGMEPAENGEGDDEGAEENK